MWNPLRRFRRPGTEVALVEATQRAQIAEANAAHYAMEAMDRLELALEDEGWEALLHRATTEFSRDGLVRSAALCRVMAVSNPLIKRGLGLRQAYVHGQGVQVSARANGDEGTQDVNAVVQAFWDDPANQASLTGSQAREELERALGTDGNVFLACFTNPRTGRVRVRSISFSEIHDIITNPEDSDEPWFYERHWCTTVLDPSNGVTHTDYQVAYYPALRYRPGPSGRLRTINGHPVFWDAPIYHVSVNRLDGWKFGIGDAYAALPWARYYKEFLVDWTVLVKALSRYAFKVTSKRRSQKIRGQVQAAGTPTRDPLTREPQHAGATAVTSDDVTLEAVPKTGATIDSESGRPLASMIAAALEVPVTTLLSDPGVTGARATAETLTEPMRLGMEMRRSLWAAGYKAICAYVIAQAVRTPQGPLQGRVDREPGTNEETVILAADTDPTVEVVWPGLDQVPVNVIVEAITRADSTGRMPPKVTARLLLQALGVEDVDELIAGMLDDEGNWVDPEVQAAQAAVDRFRRGEDPVGALA